MNNLDTGARVVIGLVLAFLTGVGWIIWWAVCASSPKPGQTEAPGSMAIIVIGWAAVWLAAAAVVLFWWPL